jgi:Putative zinc-finger
MKCEKVSTKLAGYLDDAAATNARPEERQELRSHLENCSDCREQLQRYRKLGILLSKMPRAIPPADLAIRIKVAAAQLQERQDWRGRWQHLKGRAEILFENTYRPLTVPATGGLFSAIVVFVFVLHMILPGITVQANPNDLPVGLLRPAELISLSDNLGGTDPEEQHPDVILQNDLLVDVTVDAEGGMSTYRILSGSDSPKLRHQLDQILLFSRFRPMMSFGRPMAGGHVVLSFSAVHVRG